MSWISENYEKAALGGAAVVLLGLGFLGWQNLSSVEEEFSSTPKGRGNNDATVKGADMVPIAISSFDLNRVVPKGDDDGRLVDLFTGVPLFVNKNDLNNPVDLPESDAVHPPIPNQWWIDNRIDPGFGDSPQRDADEDGFSNIDEFTAGTDPNDIRDYPSLISKLTYIGDESVRWVLRPEYPNEKGEFTFEYVDTAGVKAKVGAINPVAPGGLFFADGPVKERFKFIGSEIRPVLNEKLNAEVDTTFVTVEDQKANKKGMKYEIPALFRRNNEEFQKQSHYDRNAILSLEALGLAGQEFKIDELTEFALPADAKEKRYRLTEVTPEQIVIEEKLTDGKTVTHKIAKGATGPNVQ